MPTPIRKVKRRDPISPAGLNTPSQDSKRDSSSIIRDPDTPSKTVDRKRKHDEISSNAEQDQPQLPATPQSKRKHTSKIIDLSPFCQAKAIFQRGSRVRGVVGREIERQELVDFLTKNINASTSGALYVSGLPGTGKSALVEETTSTLSCKKAIINCMTVDRPDHIFPLIAKEFGYLDRRTVPNRDVAIDLLTQYFTEGGPSHVLVLDEIDYLMTSDQEVLFKLFEWACGASNLILLGIANAIDLTDRFLPRLLAHHLKPQVVAFKPYSTEEIVKIIERRLYSLGGASAGSPYPIMHPAAVRICAAKTAANSGDLRMAFDVCRRAIELVEEEARMSGDDLKGVHISQLPKITVPHVARVCTAAFGGVNTMERVKNLSFQQKAVLCVLIVEERIKMVANPNVTVLQVFQSYESKCKNNPAVNSLLYSEYLQVVTALEASGLVVVTGVCGKKGLGAIGAVRTSRGGGGAAANKLSEGHRDDYGQRKISSKAQLMDVVTALSDIEPLRQMLLGAL